jgi:SAM-dependent methyltransferase
MMTHDRYTDYDPWAWLYDQTMGPAYAANQLPPLETLLLPHLPPAATLLDLCCGTGHLMQPLLDRGYHLTGIDGSEVMLEYAQRNAPSAQFHLADVRNFTSTTRFDAVFSTSASLNHLLEPTDLKQVFTNVYSILKPNGWFFFDMNHAAQMEKWWRGQIAEGEIESTFAWHVTPTYQPATRLGNFKITLFQQPDRPSRSAIGRSLKQALYKLLATPLLTRFRLKLLRRFAKFEPTWQRSEMVYHVRGYTIAELQTALTAVGFTQVQAQTLNGDPTVDANHSVYFLCRKPDRPIA